MDNYDLCINTSRMDVSHAVELLKDVARLTFGE